VTRAAAVALLMLAGCADVRPGVAELRETWEGDAAAPVYVPGQIVAPPAHGRDLRAPRGIPGAPALCPENDAGLACSRVPR